MLVQMATTPSGVDWIVRPRFASTHVPPARRAPRIWPNNGGNKQPFEAEDAPRFEELAEVTNDAKDQHFSLSLCLLPVITIHTAHGGTVCPTSLKASQTGTMFFSGAPICSTQLRQIFIGANLGRLQLSTIDRGPQFEWQKLQGSKI